MLQWGKGSLCIKSILQWNLTCFLSALPQDRTKSKERNQRQVSGSCRYFPKNIFDPLAYHYTKFSTSLYAIVKFLKKFISSQKHPFGTQLWCNDKRVFFDSSFYFFKKCPIEPWIKPCWNEAIIIVLFAPKHFEGFPFKALMPLEVIQRYWKFKKAFSASTSGI